MPNTVAKGRVLEEEVADIYRQLDGVQEVIVNKEIRGVQIDVYVVLATKDGVVVRYAIDAKNYNKVVRSDRVRKCMTDFEMLRQNHDIDRGIVVSASGFAKDAHAAVINSCVTLLDAKDLRRKIHDFTPYLSAKIAEYEGDEFFRHGIYLPLSAKTDQGNNVGKIDDYLLKWLDRPGAHVTLLGNYGTGKSTTLRRLMWVQAKRYLANPENERIPIFVDLKRFRQAPGTQALITDLLVNESGVTINYRQFSKMNEDGKFLIILDGFDEMADRVLEGVPHEHFAELAKLATERGKVILSCRTHYFRDRKEAFDVHESETALFREAKSRQGFEMLFLSPFTPDDIDSYIHHYAKDKEQEYKRIISTTYDLESLAEVPILLNMIVHALPSLVRKGGPINRSAIYYTFTEQWLLRERWRRNMPSQQRLFFCTQLAFHFYRKQQTSVHWRDLPQMVREYLQERIHSQEDLDVLSTDVRTSNFLIRDEVGRYSFVHKSFMEYFVARYFVDEVIRKGIRNGLDDLRDPGRYRVIWEFLLEMLQPDDVKRIRKDLYTREKVNAADLASNRQTTSSRLYTNPASVGNAAWIVLQKGGSLERADLEFARFDYMSLKDCSLKGAFLNSASFKRASLMNVNLAGSVLAHANFDGTRFERVDLSEAMVDKADALNSSLDDVTLKSLARAKFWGSMRLGRTARRKVQLAYEKPSLVTSFPGITGEIDPPGKL